MSLRKAQGDDAVASASGHRSGPSQGCVGDPTATRNLLSKFAILRIATDSTRARGAVAIARSMQNHIGSKVIGPIPIYKDSIPTSTIVQSSNVNTKIRHIATYINYSHDSFVHGETEPIDINMHNQLADVGTKAVPRLTRTHLHHQMIGVRFYPKEGTEHYIQATPAKYL